MSNHLTALFIDQALVRKIQRKLPLLFYIAQIESSRAGRAGMEVGSKREQILVALLVYKFGQHNVSTHIPITAPEVDVLVQGEPVSIKTVTGSGGVKVVWIVDWASVDRFVKDYSPRADILLAQIQWDGEGGLFFIPKSVQQLIFRTLGKENYLRVPKRGTNPRGIEISRKEFKAILQDQSVRKIPVQWRKPVERIPEPYERWLDYWKED